MVGGIRAWITSFAWSISSYLNILGALLLPIRPCRLPLFVEVSVFRFSIRWSFARFLQDLLLLKGKGKWVLYWRSVWLCSSVSYLDHLPVAIVVVLGEFLKRGIQLSTWSKRQSVLILTLTTNPNVLIEVPHRIGPLRWWSVAISRPRPAFSKPR